MTTFFDLPPELRLAVYEESVHCTRYVLDAATIVALLATHRQVLAEICDFVQSSKLHRLRFRNERHFRVMALLPTIKAKMTDIELVIDVPDNPASLMPVSDLITSAASYFPDTQQLIFLATGVDTSDIKATVQRNDGVLNAMPHLFYMEIRSFRPKSTLRQDWKAGREFSPALIELMHRNTEHVHRRLEVWSAYRGRRRCKCLKGMVKPRP